MFEADRLGIQLPVTEFVLVVAVVVVLIVIGIIATRVRTRGL